MLGVGLTQMSLVNYLLGQLVLSEADRVDALREFAPSAVDSDWDLTVAGQRVQVIKPAKGKGGTLEFGTTVLNAADGSIAGLLGASPGASTAVPAMLDVMERCFPTVRRVLAAQAQGDDPVAGHQSSPTSPALYDEVWAWGTKVLGLRRSARHRRSGGHCVTVAVRRVRAPDLDAATLYELLKLRVEVFVVEQACPYPELDGRDLLAETRHYWLEQADGEVISTLRLMEEHSGGAKAFRIGRVCTKRTARGQGTPPDCCRRRWPRSATTSAASTPRPTWTRCTAGTASSGTATSSSKTASRTCR